MSTFQEINVLFTGSGSEERVGVLALSERKVVFEYSPSWTRKRIELSPRHLPVTQPVFQFERSRLHNGLPGLFADSLPDGWGMLIMDRFFLKNGRDRYAISPIDRLAYLGNNAMGALCYQPALQKAGQSLEAVNIGITCELP